jgi:hypothetical protein
MILKAQAAFNLAGHSFVRGTVFECEDQLAQHLVRRKLAEQITHGSPRVSILSTVHSWSTPSAAELPGRGNWIRDGAARQ